MNAMAVSSPVDSDIFKKPLIQTFHSSNDCSFEFRASSTMYDSLSLCATFHQTDSAVLKSALLV
jgi:hypothetical protein